MGTAVAVAGVMAGAGAGVCGLHSRTFLVRCGGDGWVMAGVMAGAGESVGCSTGLFWCGAVGMTGVMAGLMAAPGAGFFAYACIVCHMAVCMLRYMAACVCSCSK